MTISNMSIRELTGIKYNCSCGRIHSVEIDKIDISCDAVENAVKYATEYCKGKITVICDENTHEIAGKSIENKLKTSGANSNIHIIKGVKGLNVAPDDAQLGEVLAKMTIDTEFFIAVGSGVINDITRQISYKMGKEYMVVATAPSMDGYASVTSSLILNNIKQSIQGQYPKAIFGQIDILKNAPYDMITAGFGDVIGKYNAIREWRFGRDLNGEHYCPEIAALVENAVDKCRKSAFQLKNREEAAIINIMEALLFAGMAMGLYQNTRPASGAEHHIVHYWDVDCIKRGVEHELHGNSVGIGTVIICKLFDFVKDSLPVKVKGVKPEDIEKMLKEAGCKTSPVEAGISRELLKQSILKGNTMSDKFTVLTYLADKNPALLEKAAERICSEYYE